MSDIVSKKVEFVFEGSNEELYELLSHIQSSKGKNVHYRDIEYFEEMTFDEFIMSYVKDKLYDNLGSSEYGSDLGIKLCEEDNYNGTPFGYTATDRAFINHFDYEANETFDYLKNELGMQINPLENVGAFAYCMVEKGVRDMLSRIYLVDKFWNEKITLTEDIVKEIISQMECNEPNMDLICSLEELYEPDICDD